MLRRMEQYFEQIEVSADLSHDGINQSELEQQLRFAKDEILKLRNEIRGIESQDIIQRNEELTKLLNETRLILQEEKQK
jgi:hypothetical protein